MASAQVQRAYAPVARPNSTQSVRICRHELTGVHERTGAEQSQAPPKTHFLVELARPRPIRLSARARSHPDLGLQTRIEHATNVNLRHEGMVDEFEAPHLAKRMRRCWNYPRRPEMVMKSTSATFSSWQLTEQLRGAFKTRLCSSTPTACPTERATPNPSEAPMLWRRNLPGGYLC